MATEYRIVVVVDPSGAKKGAQQTNNALKGIGSQADRTRRLIQRTFAFVGLTVGVRQLIQVADTFTNLQNRIRTVTSSTIELNVVTDELFKVANKTRAAFESTVEVYARTALAVRELGISQRQTIQFTESLNQAVILSGASVREANAALIQLSQGLASGALRGDELRSVLEQLPVVADVIAKELKRTRGELRLLGSEGKLTAEVILKAFKSAREELEERFAETVPTIAQSVTVLRNNFVKLLGALNESSGAATALSNTLLSLADNLELIARWAAVAGLTLGIQFAVKGVGKAILAVKALTLAIATNPIGALVVIILAVVSALIVFSDKIQIGSDRIANLQDLALAFFEVFQRGVQAITAFVSTHFGVIADIFETTFKDAELSVMGVLIVVARVVDNIVGFFKGAADAVVIAWDGIPVSLERLFVGAFNAIAIRTETFINGIITAVNLVLAAAGASTIRAFEATLMETIPKGQDLGAAMAQAIADGIESQNAAEVALKDIFDRADEIARERIAKQEEEIAANKRVQELLGAIGPKREVVDPRLQKVLDRLEKEGKLLKLTNQEREIQTGLLKAEAKLKRDFIGSEASLVEEILRANQALADQGKTLNELNTPLEDLDRQLIALDALYKEGSISLAQYTQGLIDAKLAQAQLRIDAGEGSFADGFLVQLDRMVEGIRSFKSEAGTIFGSFFDDLGRGFADTIGAAIFSTESLKESLKAVARDAISNLISSLVQLGLQFVANQILAITLGTAATAATVSQAAVTASAWAPAAAFASLASFGANAGPAAAGILSTVALTESLAAAGSAFRDGGFVQTVGSSRSDSGLAALSDGEFVVNARATRSNRGTLERMNAGKEGKNGGGSITINQYITATDVDSFHRSDGQISARTQAGLIRAQRRQTNG